MFLGKEVVIEGLILELSDSALTGAAYLVKNYFSVALLQNEFVSQGKACCFSGEHCTPGATVVAMAVC